MFDEVWLAGSNPRGRSGTVGRMEGVIAVCSTMLLAWGRGRSRGGLVNVGVGVWVCVGLLVRVYYTVQE